MDFTLNAVAKIPDYVEALKESDPQRLLNVLERKVLMDEAIGLNKSVKKNTITIQVVCDAVADVRKNAN